MAQPIFIIGKHRSGTTWLGNILCSHREIFGVQHPTRHGIWESIYFSHIRPWLGKLNTATEEGFLIWCRLMKNSTYFRLSGITEHDLLKIGPDKFEVLFRKFMDKCALKEGAKCWVEKSPAHTLLADKLAQWFPDAKFIAMSRDFQSWIRSAFRHSENQKGRLVRGKVKRAVLIARLVLSKRAYDAKIEALVKKYPGRVLNVTYGQLLLDRKNMLYQIFDFLEVSFDEACLVDNYIPDSSFTASDKRSQILSPAEEWWAKKVHDVLQFLPAFIFDIGLLLRYVLRHRYRIPEWFWANEEMRSL